MSLSTFVSLVKKALKFTIARPIQRFNINNRVKNYLGPDAKYFAPAPRAIGPGVSNQIGQLAKPETEKDNNFVIGASSKLEVTKTLTKIEPDKGPDKLIGDGDSIKKPHRPLPKATNLSLSDPAAIWVADKTPPGRLNLNMLQELMLNKLADDEYWTTKVIADRYKIKEEYAESLVKYLKQIRIVVSPRMAKLLDYTGKDDPYYKAAKHIVYHVDKNLRTGIDKKFDNMFLPGEQLPEEVKELIDQPNSLQAESQGKRVDVKRIVKRPEPLRIASLNKETQESSQKLKQKQRPKKISAPKDPDSGGVT